MPGLIAMIPARMGSKRVPRKNVRFLCGKPLIRYAIDTTVEAGCFDEIWVNSESNLLGTLVAQCGVGFHKRPEKLATDTATNQDFTAEFLQRHACDNVVMVNPTSPLLKPETVQRFCSYVMGGNFDTVLSVLEERAECFFQGNPVNFSIRKKISSQELIPVEKIVWALTAWRRDHFLAVSEQGKCSVFSGRLGRFPIPLLESCDIDTQEDWDLAETMLLASARSKSETTEAKSTPRYWEPQNED